MPKEKLSAPSQIVLASSSPRRIELIQYLGVQCQSISPEVDESPTEGESPDELVERLSILKASTVAEALRKKGHRNTLIIAADTTVVSPDQTFILNKPRNEKEAKLMLETLSGETHTVLTGLTVLHLLGKGVSAVSQVVQTQVKFKVLSLREIESYIASGEPMDKAGAYGAQGLGMALIERIEGSYTNVIGLPLVELSEILGERFGVPIQFPKAQKRNQSKSKKIKPSRSKKGD